MRLPGWTIPLLLRMLSLSGLTSAAGNETRGVAIGFALSAGPTPTAASSSSASQPSSLPLSLDLNFFLQVADTSVTVPIMPLHLLGKKSWNVYNTANIEKVRRDEAAARAEEAAREEKQQEEDAARRLAILRGETPPPLAIEDVPDAKTAGSGTKRIRDDQGPGYGDFRAPKRPRKRAGEDDTDFEMRLARKQTDDKDESRQLVLHDSSKDAHITDHAGNISLFQAPSKSVAAVKAEKHPDVEAEAARKKKEQEDQYTMKFSNAAGRDTTLTGKAWYQTADAIGADALVVSDKVGKDVWGNEDPLRQNREQKRIVDNDPLAFMKRGAAQVRQVEKERKRWKEEKDKEIKELKDEDRRRRKHRREEREKRHRKHDNDDELEGFRLDGDARYRDDKAHRKRYDKDYDNSRGSHHHHRQRSDHERHHSRPRTHRDSDREPSQRHRYRD